MNQVQLFIHEQLGDVRIIPSETGNQVDTLFCAADVVKALKYGNNNISTVISRFCPNVCKLDIPHPQSPTKTLKVNFIPLPDLINLIQNSQVASLETKQELIDWLTSLGLIPDYIIPMPTTVRDEILFMDTLEGILCGLGFFEKGIRQYPVLNYKIDYYIPSLNIAIEFDENSHCSYTYEQQEFRERLIERELGCRFIRVTDRNSIDYNIGFVLKHLFEINTKPNMIIPARIVK